MNKTIILPLTLSTIIVTALLFATMVPASTQAQSTYQTPQLDISGLVQNPLNLTLSDLQAMPQTSEGATMYCVDAPTTPLQTGTWTGVRLAYLLQLANGSSAAVKVAFFAPDGFTTDLNLTAAESGTVLVAYQKDDFELSQLQLVVPGCWGYKWITNPTIILLVNYDFLGKEESLGYTDSGLMSSGAGAAAPAFPPVNAFKQPSQNPSASTPQPTPTSPPSPASTAQPTSSSPPASHPKPSQLSFPVYLALIGTALVASAIAAGLVLARRKNR